MSKTNVVDNENSNMIKDPDDWKTGNEEMTGAGFNLFTLVLETCRILK